jgi:hypothetical protein
MNRPPAAAFLPASLQLNYAHIIGMIQGYVKK